MAKASGEPVALVCTSGTAVANYYPAIVEAYYARVPLVVITADRPHELRDVGAPQAINQLHMYGSYVKWFVDMALPEGNERMLRYAEMVAARAVYVASSVPKYRFILTYRCANHSFQRSMSRCFCHLLQLASCIKEISIFVKR